MEERFDREDGRYDSAAQMEILERARQLQNEPARASVADLERMGEELGISKGQIWQAMAEYEASRNGFRKPKIKKINGQIEWGLFAVMGIHFLFQLLMLSPWFRYPGPLLASDVRWLLLLPLAAIMGLLAMGSVGKIKRTFAYLVGSMGACFLLCLLSQTLWGRPFVIPHIAKTMTTILLMELAVVTLLSVPRFLVDPKAALQKIFGLPTA